MSFTGTLVCQCLRRADELAMAMEAPLLGEQVAPDERLSFGTRIR